jgi:hypothetical protein
MNDRFDYNEGAVLRGEIVDLERMLDIKRKRLADIELACVHSFTKPEYDPEKDNEFILTGYKGHGSDPEPIYETRPKRKDRWSRECTKCGKVEYTYKRTMQGSYEPDFGG